MVKKTGRGSAWMWLTLLSAGIALGAQSCARPAKEESAPPPRVKVRVRALEERMIEDEVLAPGQWRATGEIRVSAPFPATVESLSPRPGDRVTEGEVLGRLVTRESLAALRGAEMLARQASDPAAQREANRAVVLAERDLVRVPLPAPRAGMVVRRSAEAGAQVDDAAEILAIVPLDGIVCEAHVPAILAHRVKPGQGARITEEDGTTRSAIVKRILPSADAGDQASRVWLGSAGGSLPQLDRYASVTIQVGSPRRAIVVPDSALVQDDLTGKTSIVLVTSDDQARWTVVDLGIPSHGWHELLGPHLPLGTRVVVEGQNGLPDHTPVDVTP